MNYRAGEIERQFEEMKADIEKKNLRISSLQEHIETLQRYGAHQHSAPVLTPQVRDLRSDLRESHDGDPDEMRRAHDTINKLRREQDESKKYLIEHQQEWL